MKSSVFQCITTYHYMFVSLILFFIGLLGVVLSKNIIKILICCEFLINSINLMFIAFSSYKIDSGYLGYTIVIFTTGISALVTVICLYFSNIAYRKFGTIDITKIYKKYKEID